MSFLLHSLSPIALGVSFQAGRAGRREGGEGGREGGKAYQAQDIFSVDPLVLLLHHPLGNSGKFVFAGEEAPVHQFFDQAHFAWREGGREGGREGEN